MAHLATDKRALAGSRGILLGLLVGLALAIDLPTAKGQTTRYPDRPIKIFVGFAAGGGTDVAARILAQKLTEALGQSVVMARDFVGVATAGVSPLVLVVHPSVPVRSVKELIALGKAKPGAINFGSGGLGTTPHMAGELFSLQAGIKMVHVAYRGEAPAINDLLGGQLDLIFANLSAVIGNVKAGSLRALAVTSTQRAATAPEIPTIAEVALPGFEVATWFALVAPAGTPRDIVLRLNSEVTRLVGQAEVRQRFADLGMTVDAATPDALDGYIKTEIAKWSKVIKDADIRAPE